MVAKALVQTRIDAAVKEQATVVLENMGLTVSDAVRILLTRTAKEGALPIELLSNSEAHDAWFRAKVREALEDARPDVDDAESKRILPNGAPLRFAKRRVSREAGFGRSMRWPTATTSSNTLKPITRGRRSMSTIKLSAPCGGSSTSPRAAARAELEGRGSL